MNKWIKRKLCIGVAIAMTITSIAGCNSVKSGKNSVDSAGCRRLRLLQRRVMIQKKQKPLKLTG